MLLPAYTLMGGTERHRASASFEARFTNRTVGNGSSMVLDGPAPNSSLNLLVSFVFRFEWNPALGSAHAADGAGVNSSSISSIFLFL